MVVQYIHDNNNNINNQQQPTKVLKQSNLDEIIVKSLDVEGFGDSF